MIKARYLASVLILILAGIAVVLFVMLRNERRGYLQLKAQAQEINMMKKEYQLMQERVSRIEKSAKGEARGSSGVISELLSSLGIQSKLRSVSNVEKKGLGDLERQDAEVLMNGLNMNEAVNLLYAIDQGGFPLSLRSVEMGREFESPDAYSLRMIISYFQKK